MNDENLVIEYKIEKKKEPTKNEVVATVKKEKTIENLEHRIDDSLFPMEELHSFSSCLLYTSPSPRD